MTVSIAPIWLDPSSSDNQSADETADDLTAGNGVIAPARQSRVLAIKVVTIKNGNSAIMVLHPSTNTEAQSTNNQSNRTIQSLILISITPHSIR